MTEKKQTIATPGLSRQGMKKKLYNILVLLITISQGSWAQSTSDIGKVLAADGKMYKTVAAATNAGTTASGIIAYWGDAGSVESGNSSYRGMAIAIEDAALNWGEHPNHTNYCTSDNHQCSTATSYCSTVSTALDAINGIAATTSAQSNNGEGHWHNAPLNGYNVARPSGASDWAIPSVGQWKLMAQGLTGKNSNLSDTDNPDYTYDKLSAKITAAGGNTLIWLLYWSSTEKDASKAWTFDLGGINSDRNGSRFNAIAKNHDNQYMHVRMFFAFSSATAAVYTISYNANGGSGAPSAQDKDGGIDLTLSSTVPTRSGYAFAGWNTKADGSGTSYASGATFTDNVNTTLYAQWTPDPTHFSQSGDVYTIHTAPGWGVFCDLLDAGENFSGKTVKLGADISVTRMAGSSGKDFYGTFDGQGNTLTVNITGSRDYCGTFFYVKSATFRNLKLAGTVTSAYKYAGSIIGGSEGTVSISNCQSSVTIRSSASGDGTHGGLVGRMGDSNTLSIEGCVFTGKLLSTGGSATNYCGGFVGWSNATVNISNSLYAPANIEEGENEVGAGTGSNPSKTFVRNGGTANITNSYYTRALGTTQGKQARSISAGDDVTISGLGVASATYNVSGITSYGTGIKYNDVLYAGDGDEVSLNLSHADVPEGHTFGGYTASAGNLSGSDNPYTLTMPASNVTVSATLIQISGTCGRSTSDNVTWEVTDEDGNGSYETITISGTGAMKNYGPYNQPWAAFKSDITTAVIGHGVTLIGGYAFNSYTALTSVSIASSVTIIYAAAFSGCTNLATIDGASGVTHVESAAFNGTAWANNRPDGLNYVGHVAYLFKGDGTSVTLNDATTQIADYCFYDSKITSIIIPASVERIGDFAFANSALESVIIPASVTSIGVGAFAYSALQKMYVLRSGSNPTDVTSIGDNAFEFCDNLTIVVPAAAYNCYVSSWDSYSSKLQRGYTVTGTNITATSYAPIVAQGETVTLSYTGEVPTGCDVRYSIDGGTTLLVGNTFQMPAANVTVTTVLNGPDQPFVVTTWDDLKAKMAQGGYIQLDADVTHPGTQYNNLTVPKGVTVTLDLNGHTIDKNKYSQQWGIEVAGALTLNDSGTGGTITGGNISPDTGNPKKYGFGGCVFVAPTGTFTMNGGTITGNTAENGGGGVYVANSDQPRSTFGPSWDGYQNADYDIKLGTTSSLDLKRHISGYPSPVVTINSTFDNTTSNEIDPSTYSIDDNDVFTFTPTAIGDYTFYFSADGTSLSVHFSVGDADPNNPPTNPAAPSGGTFIMNGGTISGNRTGYDGGGVYVEDGCTFTMNDGTISGNTASKGGGVFVNWGATFNLNGGTISGNTTTNNTLYYGGGAGVMLKGGTMTVSGSPVISGNTSSGRPYNLAVADNHYLRTGTLTSGANIGVTTMTMPTVAAPVTFTKSAKDGDLQYFSSDKTGYTFGTDANGQLTVNAPSSDTPWAALKTQLNAGGTVTLDADVCQTDYDYWQGNTELNISGTVNLDLAGHTITGIGDNVIKIDTNGHLTLTSSGTSGSITGGDRGVYVKNGTFNVSGNVNITGNSQNVYLTANKVINIVGPLSADARIGVTTNKKPTSGTNVIFAQGSSYTPTIGDVSRFSSDNSTYYVAMNASNEAYLTVDADDANIIVELSETQTSMPALAEGTKTVFLRSFTQDVASTICLPFSIDATQAAAAGKFYEFVGVNKNATPWEVIMQETPTSNLVSDALTANTPYLFKPAATGSVLFYGTAPATTEAGNATKEGWSFQGTYTSLIYGTNLSGNVYGFAANNYDGDSYAVSPGDFVKAMTGATVVPFRCYLTYSGSSTSRGAADSEALPAKITVRLIGSDGHATGIDSMDNGKWIMDDESGAEWYSLDGRRLSGKPSAKGIYIRNGRKEVVK